MRQHVQCRGQPRPYMRFIGMRRADPFIVLSGQADNPTFPSHCGLPVVNQPRKPLLHCSELCRRCPQSFMNPCLIQIPSSTSSMDPTKTIHSAFQLFPFELVVGSTAEAFPEAIFILCCSPAELPTAIVSLPIYSFQPMTGFSM